MARVMKNSGIEWIGEIPTNWSINKIKHHFTIVSGATPKSENAEYWDGEIPWITPADYKAWDKFVSHGKRSITEKGYNSCGTTIVPSGSLVFSKRAPVGLVVITEGILCTNQGCLSCIPKSSANSTFYYYMFSVITEQFELVSAGTTFKEIATEEFSRFQLPYPPVEEQKSIAAFLDVKCARIDSIIEKTRASIEEYKKLKQSIITQAVTKGIRKDRPMKDSGIEWIGLIPTEWDICKLRHIGYIQNGISKGGEFFGEGYPFVSYGDVYRNYSLPSEIKGLIQSTEDEQQLYSVEKGDIFFTRTSETIEEVGFSSVCEKTIPKATFAGFLIRVRPYEDILDVGYSKYYFRSNHHRFYLVKQMNLVTRASLGQPLLKGMPVLLPSKEEQIEIADYLNEKCAEFDKLIDKKEMIISELESYKKSLIYEYVTGKKEVPECQ